MRAVVVKDWIKGLNEIVVSTAPKPTMASSCVRVQVQCAGANFFDGLMAQRKYQIQPSLPFTLGSEFSGIVTEVGGDTKSVKVGDRVFGGGVLGSFAEEVVINEEDILQIPHSMDFADAAGIFITFPTAYAGLVLRAKVRPGETVLVHAAAGGVGVAAVQIAKALGATVVATCSSDKGDVARRAGADHVLDYGCKDWIQQVKDVCDGVDVVFDPVGLPLESTKLMRWNARFVVVGFAGTTSIPTIALNRILLKNISFIGLHWGAYTVHEPDAVSRVWHGLFKLIERGLLRSILFEQRFALHEVSNALEAIASRKTYGKVVIDVAHPSSKL